MTNKTLMAVLALAALLVAACGGQTQPTTAPAVPTAQPTEQPAGGANELDGTSWLLTTLNGKPVLQGATVTLILEADQAGGSDGCNRYNTSYTADDKNITFKQPMATTMRACQEAIMTQGAAYLQALGEARTYQLNGQQLVLLEASGNELATFAAQSQELSGTSWTVISYNNGKGGVVSVAAGTELTANFGADGKLSGQAGCNSYSAAYQTAGDKITIGPAVTTKMACEQTVMDQETQYLAALASAATYRIDGSKLELRTAEGALAASFQQAATGGAALSGTSWIVTGYNNGQQAVVSTMAGTDLTANFDADGMLSGNAGCNDYSASYQTAGDKITIGPAISTKKFCGNPEGVMDQETQYLAALATAATYRIDGSKLELRTAEGALAATFQRAAP